MCETGSRRIARSVCANERRARSALEQRPRSMSAVRLCLLVAVQILIAAAFLMTFFALGVPLVRRWATFASDVERLAITLGIGLAAFLLICQVLALAGVFSLPVLGSIAGIAAWRAHRDL